MKALITKTKFDFFHLILIFAALVGTLFAVFIFKTARPQAIKLIRWSPVDHYEEIIDSINKRQYPLLQNTYKEIIIHGASKIDIDTKGFIDSLQRVTQISAAAPEGTPSSSSPDANTLDQSRSDDILYITLNHPAITQVTADKTTKNSATLNLFIEVYYFMDLADIHPEEFYDPKVLTKAIKKAKAPHLFTAYQKSADSIYIDVISIK